MNLYELPFLPLKEEKLDILFKDQSIRVERIISTGQNSDWYDQDENELVFLLEGEAKLEFDNSRIEVMRKGDFLEIKAHEKHRVVYTSTSPPCIWLCIFRESMSHAVYKE
ncbi:cupin domain-containing protein [Eubacteriaceae bacterium ES3]|nr:cupin domain-containing protein [Eubacteriaceae bacterium ES3]